MLAVRRSIDDVGQALPTFHLPLSLPLENLGGGDGVRLRQDRQERRHREDLCGQQGDRTGAEALVRHAVQPP